jgi:molybdopterin molybdotransferase
VSLRSVADHRAQLLGLVEPVPGEEVDIASPAVLGLVLAEDVVARVDLPGFDNSAMDGYAVRAADLAGASPTAPVTLPVDGDIAAGDTTRHVLAPGRTMRIMTGAPMPEGADAIVPVEESDGGTEAAALSLAPEVGRHLRRRGEDVRSGDLVLTAGTLVGPGQLALAAAANVARVNVRRRPRVAVVSTGDELVPVGSDLAFGRIVDSNGPMLAALVRAAGAEVADLRHVADDAGAISAALARAASVADLVLTTGGVSMGAYDTVKELLTGSGVEFTKVAMRPGMPQGSGRLGPSGTPVVTLPGNPVSSLVSFHVFVLPVLRRLAGLAVEADPVWGTHPATALEDWVSIEGRAEWTRVVESTDGIRRSGGQGSHMLGALASGTGLALVPAEAAGVRAGDVLRVLPLLGQDPWHG